MLIYESRRNSRADKRLIIFPKMSQIRSDHCGRSKNITFFNERKLYRFNGRRQKKINVLKTIIPSWPSSILFCREGLFRVVKQYLAPVFRQTRWGKNAMEYIFHEKVRRSRKFLHKIAWFFELKWLFVFSIQQEGSLCAQHCLNALLQGILPI